MKEFERNEVINAMATNGIQASFYGDLVRMFDEIDIHEVIDPVKSIQEGEVTQLGRHLHIYDMHEGCYEACVDTITHEILYSYNVPAGTDPTTVMDGNQLAAYHRIQAEYFPAE